MRIGKKVVLCDMVADLFHYGHMSFIQKVRNYFEEPIYLIVGIVDNANNNYKRQPILSLEERIDTVKMSKLADEVITTPVIMTLEFISKYDIDYVAHGDDFDHEKLLKYYTDIYTSGKLIILPYERKHSISTTEIINRIISRNIENELNKTI